MRVLAISIGLASAIPFASIAMGAFRYSATCEEIAGQSVWIGSRPNEDTWHPDGFAGEQWTFEWTPGEPRVRLVTHGAKGRNEVEGLILLWADAEHATMLSFNPSAAWLYTIFLRDRRLMASGQKISAELMGLAPSREQAQTMGIDRRPFEQERSYTVFATCTIVMHTK